MVMYAVSHAPCVGSFDESMVHPFTETPLTLLAASIVLAKRSDTSAGACLIFESR